MPLYREWSSDAYSLAAIWKIEEPEDYFRERTGLSSTIRADRRRIEHLAGRFLLRHLHQDFPLLDIAPDGEDKPRLPGNAHFFSLSHSYPYVAAVVSKYVECGIDIQIWRARMGWISHRFLNERERGLLGGDRLLTGQAWSAKEAAYKWQGLRGVQFSEHLLIRNIKVLEDGVHFSMKLPMLRGAPEICVKAFADEAFSFAIVHHDGVFHPEPA